MPVRSTIDLLHRAEQIVGVHLRQFAVAPPDRRANCVNDQNLTHLLSNSSAADNPDHWHWSPLAS
jgi:hypothetical protein